MAMHLARAISQYQVAQLLNSAYSKVACVGVATEAFATAGIWPLNRNTFTAADFVGSLLTDRPEPSAVEALKSDIPDNRPTPEDDNKSVGEIAVQDVAAGANRPTESTSTRRPMGLTGLDDALCSPNNPKPESVVETACESSVPSDRPTTEQSLPQADSTNPVTPPHVRVFSPLSSSSEPTPSSSRMTPSQIRPFPKSASLDSPDKKRKRSKANED